MNAIAETRSGSLKGREREGTLLFAGIPYARPPVGELRFRAPQPHPGWEGVRDAQRFGPAAPQLPTGGLTANAPVRWDEDCLTLNVCTPSLEGSRPVLFWIHGGGFLTGQGSIPWYNGSSFATRGDVVTVSINYRLGALGFAHLAELGGEASSGMNGILDQIAALEWVRDNISRFGGDPERVTIAGESAGAMSVGTLLGCPAARGLFRGAILQSGAAHHTASPADANAVCRELLEELAASDLEALERASTAEILEAQMRVVGRARSGAAAGGLPFRPVVDGVHLPTPPIEGLRSGGASEVALLIGTNLDETTLFGQGEADAARLARVADHVFEDGSAALDVYRRQRPDASAGELMVALTTDQMFRIPAVRAAEAQLEAGGRAFKYLFSWPSRAFGGRLRATHALEIPFAFNNLERAGVDVFLGEGPRPSELAEAMHEAWIAFIRHGDPGWPAYELEKRPVMEFGERRGLLDDPAGEERELWTELL